MLEFIFGVVIGAMFAPVWMKVWEWLQTLAPVKTVVDFVKGLFSAK